MLNTQILRTRDCYRSGWLRGLVGSTTWSSTLPIPSSSTFDQASDFVLTCGVLEQWGRIPGAEASETDRGRRTADWLLDLAVKIGEPLHIGYDDLTDFMLVERCIRDAGM
jgi:hypothetical protein